MEKRTENQGRFPAVIPVRKGSRGIPEKNLETVGGVSLLARAIRRAREASSIGRVIVSTDCETMAGVAVDEGAEVPFLRPAELAGDETPVSAVLQHLWQHLRPRLGAGAGGRLPGLVLLQATSPFLRPETIDRAVREFVRSGAGVLKGVRRVREHPYWMLVAESRPARSPECPRADRLAPFLDEKPVRRQDLPELFIPCGAVYVYSPRAVEQPDPSEPAAWIEVTWPESLDVDDPEDLELARFIEERVLV